MDTNLILAGVGAVALALYYYFRWKETTQEERALFLQDLVQAAQQQFHDQLTKEKYEYVLTRLKARFPALPVDALETMIEAEVYRQKQLKMEPFVINPEDSARWN